MTELFITILNMSLTASYVALAIILIRLLLKKAPKIFSYALWGILLFRLICPFSFESSLSLIHSKFNAIPKDIIYTQNPAINTGVETLDKVVNTTIQNSLPSVRPEYSFNPMGVILWIGSNIWIIGMIIMLFYGVLSYIKLKHRLATATLIEGNIYETDLIKTSLVFGFVRPKIYMPVGLKDKEFDYILKHEQVHIKRRDYLIKPVAFTALAIHWFNPIIWLSFVLMVKDMEMSCDESVMKYSKEDIRGDYSNSLLSISIKQSGLISPISFGGGNTKGRIKNILNYKQPKFWVVLIGVVAVIITGIVLISNPKTSPTIDIEGILNYYEGIGDNLESDAIFNGESKKSSNDFSQEVIDIVEKNLNIVMSSPKESSNPNDYIKAHEIEYENIIKYGSEEALEYMLYQFEQGNADGLRGAIMMRLCKELLGVRNNVIDEALSPDEWYAQLDIRQEIILPDFTYDGNDPIEKLVYETEIEKSENPKGGFKIVAPHIFGNYEEDNKLKVIVTTYSSTYRLYGKALSDEGGSVIPAAITYVRNSDGSYSLEKYEQAKDGSLFAPSIEEFCTMPVSGKKIKGLVDKILDYYMDYSDIIQLERENLIKHLKANDQYGVSLYQPYYSKPDEWIPLT